MSISDTELWQAIKAVGGENDVIDNLEGIAQHGRRHLLTKDADAGDARWVHFAEMLIEALVEELRADIDDEEEAPE